MKNILKIVTNATDALPSRAVGQTAIIAAIFILFGLNSLADAQGNRSNTKSTKKETFKMNNVTGAFDVKTIPQKADNKEAEEAGLGRMSLDKQFHGDLDAVSKGEMIYAGTETEGSAVYVALERVTGKLGGKTGSFVLYHTGIMTRGASSLSVSVLPDSGTGELVGLTGTMNIRIEEGGKHFYEFSYTLQAKH